MPTVARNTFFLTSALIGQKILSFIYFTLLARFLGAETIGKYTFALAFTTIFSVVADLGLTPVLIREIARQKENAIRYARVAMAIKIVLTLLAYISALTAASLLGYPKLTLQLIALAGAIMMLDAVHLTLYGILRGFRNLKYESIGMVAGQALTLIFGSFALLMSWPLHFFLVALGLGSIFNVIYSFIAARRNNIKISPSFDLDIFKKLAYSSVPFALAGIFTKVYSYIDTVFLQHMKGDATVGWYSIPYKITYAFQILPIALSAAVYPALAAAWKKDNMQLRWIFDRALTYTILLSFPIAFGIAALAPEIILTIYGADFVNSIKPLQISIFGLIFIFLYFPLGAFLNATNHQTANTAFMGITMAANIFMNIMLIPKYGVVGASTAAVATNALLFLLALGWVSKFLRPSAYVAGIFFKTIIAVILMAFIVLRVKAIIFWPFSILAGAIFYCAVIIASRAVKIDDIKLFLQTFKKDGSSQINV